MNGISSTITGALIALAGTALTNFLTYRISKNHEENDNKRSMEENIIKKELQQKEFNNNLIVNNRTYIPNAIKNIMGSIIKLYNATEMLVVSYPGTSLTGKYPGLRFKSDIRSNNAGVPNSYSELIKIDNNFIKAINNLDNNFSENRFFLSSDIQTKVLQIEKDCNAIKSYFYSRYKYIDDEEAFKKKKSEIEKINFKEYQQNSGYGQPTHQVLDLYKKLTTDKKNLEDLINVYFQKTTNIGTK